MALIITDARALSMCNDLVDAFDSSGSAPTLVIYSGSVPAIDAAASGELVSLDLDSTAAFGAASMVVNDAVATLTGTPSGTITATGDASYFRMISDAGTVILQGTVGTGGGFDLNVDTVTLQTGATFELTSLSIKVPTGA
jgi:hypothetical protein